MHNNISLWFIFYDNIDMILSNISNIRCLTDDIHISVIRNKIDENLIYILQKHGIKISYINNNALKYIVNKSKYSWSLIVENDFYIGVEELNDIKVNIGFKGEYFKKDKYILLQNI